MSDLVGQEAFKGNSSIHTIYLYLCTIIKYFDKAYKFLHRYNSIYYCIEISVRAEAHYCGRRHRSPEKTNNEKRKNRSFK